MDVSLAETVPNLLSGVIMAEELRTRKPHKANYRSEKLALQELADK